MLPVSALCEWRLDKSYKHVAQIGCGQLMTEGGAEMMPTLIQVVI